MDTLPDRKINTVIESKQTSLIPEKKIRLSAPRGRVFSGIKKLSRLTVALLVLCILQFFTSKHVVGKDLKSSEKYFINSQAVSQADFYHFHSKLQEVPGTYHCKKATEGGSVSYDATNQEGVVYSIFKSLTSGDKSESHIDLKQPVTKTPL